MNRCTQCGAEKTTKPDRRGTLRVPTGWKRLGNDLVCNKCWQERYVLRSVELEVLGAVGMDWGALRLILKPAWQMSTNLANWAMAELFRRDITRTSDMDKLPPLPPDNKDGLYLYGLARHYRDRPRWDGCTQSLQCLLRWVRSQYTKRRYEIIWQSKIRRSTFSYPVPFPMDADNWTASYGQPYTEAELADLLQRSDRKAPPDVVPLVTLSLPGSRVTLRLRGGQEFRRQLGHFRQIVDGEAIGCEAAVYQRAFHGASNAAVSGRKNGSQYKSRVMVKLVAWLPRPPKADREHQMILRTDPKAFLVAELEGRAPWIINEDALLQKIENHRVYRQRMSEDLKFEKRWPAGVRRRMNEDLVRRCQKQNNRLKSHRDMTAALVTQFAQRQRVADVLFDDSIESLFLSYPWFNFRKKLKEDLDTVGITLSGESKHEPTSNESE